VLIILDQKVVFPQPLEVILNLRLRLLHIDRRIELNNDRLPATDLRLYVGLDAPHALPVVIIGTPMESIHEASVIDNLHFSFFVSDKGHILVVDGTIILSCQGLLMTPLPFHLLIAHFLLP